jgi:glycosyltransferase 2 family protein
VNGLRKWGRALIGLVIAGVFVALLARSIDGHEVRRVFAGATWTPLLLAVLALAADMGARITRWWLMLRAAQPDLPWISCVRPFLGSLALNNTVPLRAGDVVRVFGFRQTLRAPTAHVLGTLLLERMLDLLVLLAILSLSVLGTAGAFPRAFFILAYLAGAVCVGALLAITLMPRAISRAVQWLVSRTFAGRRWAASLNQIVDQLTQSLALLRSPLRASRLLGLSLVAWLLEGAVFACVLRSLQVQVPWPAAWLSLAAATLATLLPSSPGYVGTFDYFASLGLTGYGAPPAGAAAFAVLAHLVLWLPITLVGLSLLLLGRQRSTSRLAPDIAAGSSGVVT